MAKKRFTQDEIAKALKAGGGLYTSAARKLGCSGQTISNYIKRSPKLQKFEREIVDENLDLAESQLLAAIKEGHISAIIFYLKTKGKHRGYTERHELTGQNNEAITVDYKTSMLARVNKILERKGNNEILNGNESRRIGSDTEQLELLGEGEST